MATTPYQEKRYVQSDTVTQAQEALQNQQANKPGAYQSQWQGQMNDVLNQYQNRDKFQYDVNSDALYQQVAQNYIQQGQQAMMDTMGQAAALTGGYGNSYAQNAGQQAYQGYLQNLTNLVPQYYQMALDRYQMEGDDLLNRYNLLAQQEENAYGRYQDDLNRYYADLDRLQSAYDNERDYDYSRFADDRDFDYGKYMDQLNYQYQLDRDAVSDDQWAQQWAYQQERDKIADAQWQQEFDEAKRQYDQNYALSASKSSGGSGKGSEIDNTNPEDDGDEVYRLYQQAVSQGYGSTAAKNALKEAGYSDAAINSAMDTYKQKVIKPLSNPVKTKHGTM